MPTPDGGIDDTGAVPIGRIVAEILVDMGVVRTCINCGNPYDQDDEDDRRSHWPPCWICVNDWGHPACQH